MNIRECLESGVTLEDATQAFRESYLRAALELACGNQTRAAELIGVHRNIVWRWCKRARIDWPKFRVRGSIYVKRRTAA